MRRIGLVLIVRGWLPIVGALLLTSGSYGQTVKSEKPQQIEKAGKAEETAKAKAEEAAKPTGEKKPAATFSIEAVAVNSVPLPGGPVSEIKVAPGTIIKAEMFIRDWSPNGEVLRSYQAELDYSSYISGEQGSVKPVGYDTPPPPGIDSPHAYVDKSDPRFVHRNMDAITIADVHQAPGYRWINVLLNQEEAPVCPQDGEKYYLGTVDLQASKDAKGTFTIKFVEGEERTGLRDPMNVAILPVAYEPLVIHVQEEYGKMIVRGSVPSDGDIDARLIDGKNATTGIELMFLADASNVKKEDFQIEDGTSHAPRIAKVASEGPIVHLRIEPGLAPGQWTTITYLPTKSKVRIGCLPGDVNNDGVTDSKDVATLLDVLSGTRKLPLYRTDMNRDGVIRSADVVALIDYIAPSFSKQQAQQKLQHKPD